MPKLVFPFPEVKPGQIVTRMLAGVVPKRLKVTSVDGEFIHCGWWKFDRRTGAEVDEELGWGPRPEYRATGSFLTEVEDAVEETGNSSGTDSEGSNS